LGGPLLSTEPADLRARFLQNASFGYELYVKIVAKDANNIVNIFGPNKETNISGNVKLLLKLKHTHTYIYHKIGHTLIIRL
jgi:uncharacterized protein (UPF0333 family)